MKFSTTDRQKLIRHPVGLKIVKECKKVYVYIVQPSAETLHIHKLIRLNCLLNKERERGREGETERERER